jgi:glycosyltransferase involved in cell wall biosynthesis
VCTVVSEPEREIFGKFFPKNKAKVEIIPNGVDTKVYRGIETVFKQNSIIFTGSFKYHPNYEAMVWFINYVFPLILNRIPDAHLMITGDHVGLLVPESKNVTLTGYVNDINDYISSSGVSIAPLLSGGGTRLKILEAMAIGTPVVATSKGAEGLDARNKEQLIIADTPESFANGVIEILKTPDLRQQLSSNGKKFVREKFDWSVIIPKFLDIVSRASTI